eukprot:CAMPEP_0115166852 /NCGR_PEP_ID=MMETSP0227-20121206/74342_1 /TAXON_ID=89957 /ORGANISM="Polarella glacialis, Strain CCMP 1383" /LENGTH=222 /DNA_ID=CAMNT_0002579409 /DNA_START=193 /DNA_END=862 /DNA_ORIENTATION=+
MPEEQIKKAGYEAAWHASQGSHARRLASAASASPEPAAPASPTRTQQRAQLARGPAGPHPAKSDPARAAQHGLHPPAAESTFCATAGPVAPRPPGEPGQESQCPMDASHCAAFGRAEQRAQGVQVAVGGLGARRTRTFVGGKEALHSLPAELVAWRQQVAAEGLSGRLSCGRQRTPHGKGHPYLVDIEVRVVLSCDTFQSEESADEENDVRRGSQPEVFRHL